MVEFLSKYGIELVMSLITAGALAFCKYMYGQMKNYKKLLEEKDHDELDDEIDKKLKELDILEFIGFVIRNKRYLVKEEQEEII